LRRLAVALVAAGCAGILGCQVVDQTPAPGPASESPEAGAAPPTEIGGAEAGAVAADAAAMTDAVVPDAGAPLAVSAGWEHTCLLTSAGAVLCWGSNEYGQLGNGSTSDSAVPVLVTGLTSGVSALSVGYAHACAVVVGGDDGGTQVMCWGHNDSGQLGDGTTTDRSTPVAVTGIGDGVTAVAAGGEHSCALAAAGVSCWGSNLQGQLGSAGGASSPTPVAVAGLAASSTSLTAGGAHTCAMATGGTVQCWGDDDSGQLGSGSTAPTSVPVSVTSCSGATSLCAGNDHTCAVAAGAVQCWGYGQYGQLGNGVTLDSDVPVQVTGLQGATKVASGGDHSCAIDGHRSIWCWGNDQSGQLGDDGSIDSASPVQVVGVTPTATSLGLGTAHSCAVLGESVVACWGWNVKGQLGNGTTTDSAVPVEVTGF
jgi:hypothetical protein